MIAAFTLSDPDQNQTRTELPLYYEIDDNSVARLIVTREEALKSHWKFNHSKYGEVTDETGRNSGTIYGLPIVGNDNAWNEGKFGNALLLDGQDGYVNFGPLQLDGSFSFSFWVKPDLNSTEDGTGALLSKFGISTMNHFQISKEDGNGSVKVDYYPDGLSTPVSYSSGTNILENGTWSFLPWYMTQIPPHYLSTQMVHLFSPRKTAVNPIILCPTGSGFPIWLWAAGLLPSKEWSTICVTTVRL